MSASAKLSGWLLGSHKNARLLNTQPLRILGYDHDRCNLRIRPRQQGGRRVQEPGHPTPPLGRARHPARSGLLRRGQRPQPGGAYPTQHRHRGHPGKHRHPAGERCGWRSGWTASWCTSIYGAGWSRPTSARPGAAAPPKQKTTQPSSPPTPPGGPTASRARRPSRDRRWLNLPTGSLTAPSLGPRCRRGHKLLRLGERYTAKRLDAACRRALHAELIDVPRVECILVQALEQETLPELSTALPASPGPAPSCEWRRKHETARHNHSEAKLSHQLCHVIYLLPAKSIGAVFWLLGRQLPFAP